MLLETSTSELNRDFLDGRVSAREIAGAVSQAVAKTEPHIHALLHWDEDALHAQATALDEKRARGETLGPLAGIPVAIKDALCTKGIPTTAGSKMLGGYVPPYDATVVSQLKVADALLIGKTNMDEFAMGSSGEYSAFGPTRNPWDLTRSPGGSSSGSAAAVAARMCLLSLGSDTGGSIRQPASFTGIVGVKPTYGRVSRYGLVAFASSLDQVGPFSTDVRGAARLLSVLSVHDPKDATSHPHRPPPFEAALGKSIRGLRIGIPREYFGSGLDPHVHAMVQTTLSQLEKDGARLLELSLPHTSHAVAAYYVLANAEASSNLARYDGIRFGLRENASTIAELIGASRDAGFGSEVKRRILLGTYVLSSGYYDAYYRKAERVRRLIQSDFARAWQEVDVLCTPTSPTTAFRLGEKKDDPLRMYMSDVDTLPASLAGIPAVSVPCGLSGGLPVGLQLLGPHFEEQRLFSLAHVCEAYAPPIVSPQIRAGLS